MYYALYGAATELDGILTGCFRVTPLSFAHPKVYHPVDTVNPIFILSCTVKRV